MANWTLDGGNNDTVGTDLPDLILGLGGNDTLRGSGSGTSPTDNDSLYGGEGNDSLDGGFGDDLIEGGPGADTLAGGAGSDTLSYASSGAAVTALINTSGSIGIGGDAGGDSIAPGNAPIQFEALLGSGFEDSLRGEGSNFTLYGEAGADTLQLGAVATTGSGWVLGGEGNDRVVGGQGNNTLVGDAGDDVLSDLGAGGVNSLSGGAGNDTISTVQTGGSGGTNTLFGGAGDDSLLGSPLSGTDSLVGDGGNDTLVDLGVANTRLDGGGDDDSLVAGSGSDTLIGGTGRDTLASGAGNDSLVGDAEDVISVAGNAGALTINLQTLQVLDSAGEQTDRLLGEFGGVLGGEGGESILGNAGANTLIGNGGADRIDGAGGDDLIRGGAGNDTLIAGAGVDTISYADTGAAVTVNLAGGRGGGTAAGFNDSISAGFEAVEGGGGHDCLIGTTAAESLYGDAGNDTLADTQGTAGNWLQGGLGNDSLVGGAGGDTLLGGVGANAILAGDGADSILGGGGQDSVVAGDGDDRILVPAGAGGRMTIDGGAGNDMLDLGLDAWVIGSEAGFTTYSFDNGSGGPPESVVWATGIEQVICFYPGTLIATPEGPRAVETLGIGDCVLTAEGAVAPVRWMGRQTVSTRFGDPLRVLPIRILAGALGEGLPERDLLVSPDHAILVAGVLAQAGALVNGVTIRREHAVPERFTYHHVELATHALILAEGVPAESFVDNIDRGAFDNWAEHEALYGHLPSIAEMPLPRAKARRQVPRSILAMLEARAGLRAAG